jgi:glycosyltransferase involved in cell wall biosynthesis
MRLVQTLVVRDEVDIVGHQIAYHLDAGVDFVIATDHESRDGTTEILESFASDGYLRRIPVEGPMHDGPWRTRMARLAATEHGADWVINTDADEFWTPRQGSLKDVFSAVPEPFGVVLALSRHFAPRPDDGAFFAERMTLRVSPPAAINDPTSPYRPHLKAAHRADPGITIRHGSHGASSERWKAIHNWHPAEVLHFPFRSARQWENKGVRRARGDSRLGQYVIALKASEEGRADARYSGLVVDDAAVERGLAEGSLVVDTRLRDAMRRLRGESVTSEIAPSDPGVVSESAAVRDADLVRLARHHDLLAARVSALEAGTSRGAGR